MSMNRYIILLILPLLSFIMTGCDDSAEDVKPINLDIFTGTWQVVDQGNQNVLPRACILNIVSSQIHEGFVGYQGYVTTFFLTVDGTPKHDKVFTWTIQEEEGKQPLLNLAYQGDLDSDDIWDGDYPFKIVKLTDTFMWWQVNTIGDNSIVKLRRHADINLTRDFMRQIY